MKKIITIATIMLVALSLGGCKKDNENDNVTSGTVADPTGTVMINLRNDALSYTIERFSHTNDECSVSGELYLGVDKSNNLCPGAYASVESGLWSKSLKYEILSLGNANGLGNLNIDKVPSVGWAESIAAVKGNLYVIRYTVTWVAYHSKTQYENAHYYGLYVVDSIVGTDNGVLGYTVKYCRFTPGKGWNQ